MFDDVSARQYSGPMLNFKHALYVVLAQKPPYSTQYNLK